MSKDLVVYLAGAMKDKTYDEINGWRFYFNQKMSDAITYLSANTDITIINPANYYNYEHNDYQSEREVMNFDLRMVKKSDIVVVNLCDVNTSVGTIIELYTAYKMDIPIIAILDPYLEQLHPWIDCMLTRVERSIDDAVKYICNFYIL